MENKYQLGYFAHSMEKYNTAQEQQEYDFIVKHFNGFVICPNKHIGERGSIEPYLGIVAKVDVVFVSEFEGCVGRGVYEECICSMKNKIPVYVLKEKKKTFYFEVLTTIEIIDRSNWKKFGKLKSKKYSPKKLSLPK
jgi:hypothetical protein